ncbi:MAG: MBL fold metallo-hydrolase [Thiohalocapsa sp.]
MSQLGLCFLGVGNSQALALGSSSAVLEVGDAPRLLIDCGPGTLDAYLGRYGESPRAIFITHAHFDHVGGLEGLYYRLATSTQTPAPVRLYVPVTLIPVLQRRLADYPNLLAEGGSNFWDVFQLVPVSEAFWHEDWRFTVFPVRHHEYLSAFGLALEGMFLYSGDTRPIPEVVNRYANRGEWIFHDCCSVANPSHTGVDDLMGEYKSEQWQRMVVYHYESEQAGRLLEARGLTIAHPGQRFALDPRPPLVEESVANGQIKRLPGAVGW